MSDDLIKTQPGTDAEPVAVHLLDRSFSFKAVARVVLITLAILIFVGIIVGIFYSLSFLVVLLALSIFLAYLIDPLVKLIRRPFKSANIERFMPRPLAILISYALVFTLFGFGIAYIAPIVVEQGKEFGNNFPKFANSIQRQANELNRRFERLRIPDDLQNQINEGAIALGQSVTATFGSFVISFLSYLPWLVIVPVLTFFFLKDVNTFRISFLRMFPPGRLRDRADAVLVDINSTLASYARAMLISAVLIGTICTAGFYAIGLKYAFLLGILAGIFEFVPLLGPLAIGIIATASVAFGEHPGLAIYVAIFLLVLRLIHDYVTYPRIIRGKIHLHPLLIIITVLAGEQIAGIPGVFLAIPIVALLTVIYKHILEHQGSTGILAGLADTPAEPVTVLEPALPDGSDIPKDQI
jgi:predicted PurR-regulated permease PerM